jgi:hypothetical protein
MEFRYGTGGEWLRGNTHLHTTASDGGKDLPEIAGMYAQAGYDFLFCTDHWHLSDVESLGIDAPLLLDGVELDGDDRLGSYFHVVCLGRLTGIKKEMGFENALEEARDQGALLILAHPYWTGNTLEQARRFRFDGVEVYNHVCRWLNGKGDGGVHWDAMLAANPACVAIASDDAHLVPQHPGWKGGWIMVNAAERTREAIMDSIESGRFYSSCGPEIVGIEASGRTVHIRTSPVSYIRAVGPGGRGHRVGGFSGETFVEAEFDISPEWQYAYIEVEDSHGRRAWTNNLFV